MIGLYASRCDRSWHSFVLRIILARVTSTLFVVNVDCAHLDEYAADTPGFRVPGHKITNFESLRDHGPAVGVRLGAPVKPSPSRRLMYLMQMVANLCDSPRRCHSLHGRPFDAHDRRICGFASAGHGRSARRCTLGPPRSRANPQFNAGACRKRSLALGSPTVICPPLAVCGTGRGPGVAYHGAQ
jgi:hypothetical protein